MLRCNERERLANVAAPLLYIRANQDHLVGRASVDAIKSVKPSVTIARIDGPHLIVQRSCPVFGSVQEMCREGESRPASERQELHQGVLHNIHEVGLN